MAENAQEFQYSRLIASLPKFDGSGSWRNHEEALNQWRIINIPVRNAEAAWQKLVILYSLTGQAAERASIVGRETQAHIDAAGWDAVMAQVRAVFCPPIDTLTAKTTFKARKQRSDEDIGAYITSKTALFRSAYPQDQRQFDILLDEVIAGCCNNVIKRQIRRANPEDENELMQRATAAVAAERLSFNGGYAESTVMDGLSTVLEQGRRPMQQMQGDGIEPMEVDTINKSKETRKCYNCNKYGHLAKDCRKPKKKRDESRSKNDRRCYNCGRSGHLIKDCRLPRKKKKEEVKSMEEEDAEPEVFEEEET